MGSLFTLLLENKTKNKVIFTENEQERSDRERKVELKVRARGLRAPFEIFTATNACVLWLPLLYFEFPSQI